jgi:uncharacterized protein (DUF305 family)
VNTVSRLAGPLAALVLAVAGCTGDGSGTGHDRADVEFASEMVPRHEQALRMVAMTRGRDLSPDFARLTRGIRAARVPEIQTMEGWLDDWGEAPDDGGSMMDRDHDGAMMDGGGMMGGRDPVPRIGRPDFHRLGHAPDRDFEDLWLRMMIRHHRGSIALSEDEVENGRYPAATALARHVEDAEMAEIRQMRAMLAG